MTAPNPTPRPGRLAAPLLRETLRRRRVPLGRLRETLTAAAAAELRRRGAPPRARRARLGHLRRFIRAFAHRAGLPREGAVREHLAGLLEDRRLPRRFAVERARAVELLYRHVLRLPGPGALPAPPPAEGPPASPPPGAAELSGRSP